EFVTYAATKGAIDTLTLGLAREVAKEGIRVNAVRPGVIDTEIHPPGRVGRVTPMLPIGRPGQADEVAETILFLLSEAASYVTRPLINVSGGGCRNALPLPAGLKQNHENAVHRLQRPAGAGMAASAARRRSADRRQSRRFHSG